MLVIFASLVATLDPDWGTAGCDDGKSSILHQHAQAAEQAKDSNPVIDELLGLMRRRLLLMHDVARAKWNAKTPLADPDREKIMLRELAEKGRALGLEPEITNAFFEAQVEASKLMQSADFLEWQAERRGPFTDALDLKRDLRPRIDTLNGELLAALAKARPILRGREAIVPRLAAKALEGQGITPKVRDQAIRPLIDTSSKAATRKSALLP